jgi:hypothetical protein
MLKVALKDPPAPELIVVTLMPPTPRVLMGPMSTSKLRLAGKLYVKIVTLVSGTTLAIEKVGIADPAWVGSGLASARTSKTASDAAAIGVFIQASCIHAVEWFHHQQISA